jgi:transcriptional regulator with XRE-family HTH domain
MFLSAYVGLRFAGTRVERLRKTLRLSKAETARRAQLTPSEYAKFEPPKGRQYRYRARTARVRRAHAEQLAVVLGCTADYIATGKTDARPLPPNDPRKPLLREIELERKRTAAEKRKRERDSATYTRLLDEAAARNAALETQKGHIERMGLAALEQNQANAEWLGEQLHALLQLADTLEVADRIRELQQAAARMKAGEPARPRDPEPEQPEAFELA